MAVANPLLLDSVVCEILYIDCEKEKEWACEEYERTCVERFVEELREELERRKPKMSKG